MISGLASSSVKTCSKASACRAASAPVVRTCHRRAQASCTWLHKRLSIGRSIAGSEQPGADPSTVKPVLEGSGSGSRYGRDWDSGWGGAGTCTDHGAVSWRGLDALLLPIWVLTAAAAVVRSAARSASGSTASTSDRTSLVSLSPGSSPYLRAHGSQTRTPWRVQMSLRLATVACCALKGGMPAGLKGNHDQAREAHTDALQENDLPLQSCRC